MIDTQTIKTKLKELNQSIETIICSFLEDIKEQIEQIENPNKLKRVSKNERYYLINDDGKDEKAFSVSSNKEDYDCIDDEYFNTNNYFCTQKRAQEVVDKIHFLLRLERLHDELCLDYKPCWENRDIYKYCVYYDSYQHKYNPIAKLNKEECQVYFPTEKIAQKACDILNNESEINK